MDIPLIVVVGIVIVSGFAGFLSGRAERADAQRRWTHLGSADRRPFVYRKGGR